VRCFVNKALKLRSFGFRLAVKFGGEVMSIFGQLENIRVLKGAARFLLSQIGSAFYRDVIENH